MAKRPISDATYFRYMREMILNLRKLAKSKKPSDPIQARCDQMRAIVRNIQQGKHGNPAKGKQRLVQLAAEIAVIKADGGEYIHEHHRMVPVRGTRT